MVDFRLEPKFAFAQGTSKTTTQFKINSKIIISFTKVQSKTLMNTVQMNLNTFKIFLFGRMTSHLRQTGSRKSAHITFLYPAMKKWINTSKISHQSCQTWFHLSFYQFKINLDECHLFFNETSLIVLLFFIISLLCKFTVPT